MPSRERANKAANASGVSSGDVAPGTRWPGPLNGVIDPFNFAARSYWPETGKLYIFT
jgi:hypothetical protein